MTATLTALWTVALLLFATTQAPAAEPRRVLLLHAFGHAYSPWSDMASSFRAELIKKSPERIDLYEVSLDTAQVQELHEEGFFIDYVQTLLKGRKLDLIVPVGAPAAFFVQRNRQRLPSSTRVLIFGADHRRIPESSLTVDDATALHENDMPAHLENILRLLPETKNVAVVVGSSPVERYWASELKRDFQPFTDRVNITWFDELTLSDMLTQAATMPPNSAIFFLLLIEDAAGVPYTQNRALEKFREVANAPIFGLGDFELGRGVVGGPALRTQAIGERAAQVAIQILAGEPPSRLKFAPLQYGSPSYDWRELRRWNISEALLPPGSVVQFRESTFWELYRWQIAVASAIVLFQTALIAGLLIERERRQRAATQASKATAESGQHRENLAHLVRVHAVGEMSTAIAHEINQPLAAIKNYAFAAQRWLTQVGGAPKVGELLNKIEEQASRGGDVLQSLRTMVKKHNSSPAKVDIGPLVAETLKLAELQSRVGDIRLESSIATDLPPVFVDKIQIQQVLLNLTRNAIEAMAESGHTGAINVGVAGNGHGEVAVSVADSGPEIGPDEAQRVFEPFYSTKGNGLGVGLSISRAIIEAHGGRLSLTPNAGGGSVFQFTLPAMKAAS